MSESYDLDDKRRHRRNAILDIASASFLDKGFAATTMSEIAANLGGSKTTLWTYFPSKEALFEAVLEYRTSAYRQQLADVLDPQGDLRTVLTGFCESFLRKVTSPEALALHRLVHAEAPRFPRIGQIFHERAPRMTQRLVAAYLAGCISEGRIEEGDPELMARQLIGLCLSGCYQRLQLALVEEPSAASLRSEAADAAKMFMKARALR